MRKFFFLTVVCALGLFGSLKAQETNFSYNFDDGSLAGWRVFFGEAEGDGYASWDHWKISPEGDIDICGYKETRCIYSDSYPNGAVECRNYIVTENAYKITESSVLSWYVRHADYGYENNDPYRVVISESGADDSFTKIWDGTYVLYENSKEISLAEYAGKTLYIGFYHYGYDGGRLCIDNIVLSSDEGNEEPEAPTVPAAPVIAAKAVADSIYITWEAVENADYYTLYYQDQLFGNVAETYANIAVPYVGEYCFTVTASNEVGESDHSNKECVTVECPEGLEVPAAPVLTAGIENDSIVISWEPVETASYYIVYFEGQMANMLYVTEAKLYPSIIPETYCFTVTAVNLAGESPQSNEACVTYTEDGINENETSFNIYPNPVGDKLYIETEMEMEEVVVYDVYGRVMISEQVNGSTNQQVVDASNMNAGVYFVMIKTNDGNVTKRFVKK